MHERIGKLLFRFNQYGPCLKEKLEYTSEKVYRHSLVISWLKLDYSTINVYLHVKGIIKRVFLINI